MNSLTSVLPPCDADTTGACFNSEAQGAVVFSAYQECAQSPILLPGFNLLPRWFLTSALFIWDQSCAEDVRVSHVALALQFHVRVLQHVAALLRA